MAKSAGRPFGTKNIESPEKMWEYFTEYRDEVKSNPILMVEQRKGNVMIPKGMNPDDLKDALCPLIHLPLQKPLTMEGFQNYLDDNDIISDVTDYFENKEGRYADFIRICSRIKRTIRQDQIEGGMAGIYNPSITQRLNGLVDKQDNETRVAVTGLSVEIIGGISKPVTSEKEAEQ